jgi:hypothetical protein
LPPGPRHVPGLRRGILYLNEWSSFWGPLQAVERFPSDPQRFSVFAVLTDALGSGTIELVVSHLDKAEEVYSQIGQITFPDRLRIVNTHIRVHTIRFHTPGLYEVMLLIDNEAVAQRKLRVYQK